MALVRQWRLPAEAALLEIPAGGLDVGPDGSKEDPEPAARRELEEETGVRAGTWHKLGAFYSAPGFTDELMHLYLATDLSPASADGRLRPEDDERLILEWRPWRDAVAAAERGEIRDAKSLVGLFWLARVMDGRVDGASDAGSATSDSIAVANSDAADASGPGVTVGEVARATFRMSTGEIAAASVALTRRSMGSRLLGLAVVAMSLFGIVTTGDLLSIAFLVLGVSLITGWFAAPLAWYQARKRPDLISAETTLTADDRGMHFANSMVNSLSRWDTYRSVHESSGFFFLDASTGMNQVVPIRVFSPTDLATFYRLLDRHGLLPGSATKRPTRNGKPPYGTDG